MPDESSSSSGSKASGTVIWFAVLLPLLCSFWSTIFFIMPAVRKQYGFFGLAYSDVTGPVMKVSMMFLNDWTGLLPVSIVCVIAAIGFGRYAPVKRRIGALFVQLLTVFLILSITIMFACAVYAERSLVDGLSRYGIPHVGRITGYESR